METDRYGYKILLSLYIFLWLLGACSSEKDQIQTAEDKTIPTTLSNNQTQVPPTQDSLQEEVKNPQKSEEDKSNPQPAVTTAHQKLLQTLDKGAKIEYAPHDYSIIKNDTLVKAKSGNFQFTYATSCLNDSLIAQEMVDYAQRQSKSYLISHNYQTNISIRLNGIATANKLIQKDLFKGKLDQDFLEKSIIKHPNFVRFDEERNEAIFEFMVGVPNTDWLIIAGVNLNSQGTVRIIDIMMPDM
ncbi:MAG: DUF4738 domain-containing protein [Microscillaceae bacterium]|jgi:hypothetical protein|nr:DUF4738 domain-containing protein [Microscillaceae bacterium]